MLYVNQQYKTIEATQELKTSSVVIVVAVNQLQNKYFTKTSFLMEPFIPNH